MPDILPTDDWQTKINAASTGTVFTIKRGGVHTKARNLSPKTNMQFNGDVGPNGELPILDGQFAENKHFISTTASGIQIKNLEIKNYWRTTLQSGIIDFGGGSTSGGNAIIDGLHLHHCIGIGIKVGPDIAIRNCDIHNLYQSIGGGSPDVLIEDNHWYDLNYPDPILQPYYKAMVDRQLGQWDKLGKDGSGMYFVKPGFQAGFKLAHAINPIVRRNEINHINGNGLWLDMNGGTGYDFYENHLYDSPDGGGIHIEITHGPGKVHDNILENVKTNENPTNMWAIQIGESSNVDVYRNTVRNCQGGIGIRASSNRAAEGDVARDNKIRDNTIEHCGTLAGVTSGETQVLTNSSFNNKWTLNRYRSTKSNPFSGNRTWAQWKAIPQDADGTFNATAPPTSRHGSSTIGVSFGVTTVGKKRGKGSGSVSATFSVIGSGGGVSVPTPHGRGNVDVGFEVIALGRKGGVVGVPAGGIASIPVAFGVTALGHKEPTVPPPIGSSSISTKFAITARGHKNAHGKGRIDLALSAAVSGAVVPSGSSSVPVAFAVTGDGRKGAIGSSQVDVGFGVDGVGEFATTRHGTSTIGVKFTVAPFTDADDENSGEEPHGTAHKHGFSSIPTAIAVTALGHGQTSGGSGGPPVPPDPGGVQAPILPEEYRENRRMSSREDFT